MLRDQLLAMKNFRALNDKKGKMSKNYRSLELSGNTLLHAIYAASSMKCILNQIMTKENEKFNTLHAAKALSRAWSFKITSDRLTLRLGHLKTPRT
jgi:hypothetical protein